MILDTLTQYRRYTSLSPRFAAAFEFLKQLPADKANGRYDLDGDNCFALVQAYATKPADQAKFETHRQYIDIQFIQSGRETMLWAPLAALTQVIQPYIAEKDVIFYATPPHMTPINFGPGQFVIFFPTDGHAGGLECEGPSEVRKVVIKVRV
jgi:YhcH/YjgK/YiaL family protein